MDKLRGITFEKYAAVVRSGEILTRAEIAERMCVSYSTATYHLDRAVRVGLLNRQYGYISNQPGWLYAQPDTMPRIAGT